MKTLRLGRSSLTASRLAYGCWRLAGSEGGPAVTSSEPGRRAVFAAMEAGYTLFDLADIYGGGRCEEIFGEALRELGGLRERILIATKCGIRKPGPATGAPYRYDFSGSYIVSSVEGSLRRMGIETIDLLMLHRPDYLMDPHEVAGAFLQLKDAGKVREFGVSNFRPSQVAALQKAVPLPLVANQVELSLHQLAAFDDGVLDQCLTEKLTPMAWSPLDKGVLVGGRLDHEDSTRYHRQMQLRAELDNLASSYQVTPGAIALAWLLRHPAGIQPVIGSTNPGNIAAATKADGITLTREEWYRLLEAARGSRLP